MFYLKLKQRYKIEILLVTFIFIKLLFLIILNNSLLDYENKFDNMKILTENERKRILRPGLNGALFAGAQRRQKSGSG